MHIKIKPYHKITLIYFLVGVVWIFFSDRLLAVIAFSTPVLTILQTVKGWIFIIFTSALLYSLVRKTYFDLEEREKEKRTIFFTTMSAVHHILNNFLNKMMFFRHVAEESNEFANEVLDQYTRVIKETSEQITKLGEIDKITQEEIEKTAYPNKLL